MFIAAAMALAPPNTAAQTATSKQPKTAQPWAPPRTADGRPDLQGIWSNATLTPFERPKELEGKDFFEVRVQTQELGGIGESNVFLVLI